MNLTNEEYEYLAALARRAEAAEARAAELVEHNREQAETITTLRAERDAALIRIAGLEAGDYQKYAMGEFSALVELDE